MKKAYIILLAVLAFLAFAGLSVLVYFLIRPKPPGPKPVKNIQWKAEGEFPKCKEPCGEEIYTRKVYCWDGEKEVDAKFCENKEKPKNTHNCGNPDCQWKESGMSDCDTTVGYKHKQFECPRDPSFCGDKPDDKGDPCGEWSYGPMGDKCLNDDSQEYCAGKKYAPVVCKAGDNTLSPELAEYACKNQQKPDPKTEQCLGQCSWQTSEWRPTP